METVSLRELEGRVKKLEQCTALALINKTLVDKVSDAIPAGEPNKDLVGKFKEIVTGLADTYERKNHDYGNSFDKSLDKFGITAAVVRLGDKMNRIESLIKKEAKVNDESIKDTLADLANYAIMTIMWLENNE